ncbi:glycosyl hydrolase [Lichenicola cladoniae]|uniref:Glycosyl hydrolase n=1 Tax=Lichenicola cladoniae TaxID=1484109 RepID=A0A6M8HSV1_9PROT|nr:glycoside hydrolase family 3 C-terminal domain-containing protein [Lichenicola cladoniae]NPD65328.1 glycosyl hydrolase [Acetobacteraceae bacterium]QKE91583.1 glycosyl hydrolase [Lichenicola cladoniae]
MHKKRSLFLACTAMSLLMSCRAIDVQTTDTHAAAGPADAEAPPWMDASLSPDRRARMLEQRLSTQQLLQLVYGYYAVPANYMLPANVVPQGAVGSAGFVPGIPELLVPALQESDAGTGVADPVNGENGQPIRGAAGYSTELPSGLATAATWNRETAFRGGAMIGEEAHREGFNVLLAGGVNLAREPRNGRNFEYGGEDPLLAGTMVGEQIRGIQSRHVVSTIKHYALNDQETGRNSASSNIDWTAARQSDLLAFELALDIGKPGSVMCSYNRVNSAYACGNDVLLNQILKGDWGYKGWVMSDWGAVHAVTDANGGLDQESGSFFDQPNGGPFFTTRLEQAIHDGTVKPSRLLDMAHRILRSEFANGLFDDRVTNIVPIDAAADAAVAQADEQEGIVLLKNAHSTLPLSKKIGSVAIIGSNAANGVLEGGGSSQVWPVGGPAAPVDASKSFPRPLIWNPSSPMAAMKREAPNATFSYDTGADPSAAAAVAAKAQVAIVFVNQRLGESIDAASLSLPADLQTKADQDALVRAVVRANPNTIVVVESGGPVLMPWLAQVMGVLEAWYPGSGGGAAIANVLFGDVNPSGHLPLTFPASECQLPRPVLDVGTPTNRNFPIDYTVEGAAVGYKWFQKKHLTPLFPFGYGLSYTTFSYGELHATSGNALTATFTVTNTGARAGYAVPQLYLGLQGRGEAPTRLVGFAKVMLQPHQSRSVSITADPRLLAEFDGTNDRWVVKAGHYPLYLGTSANDIVRTGTTTLSSQSLAP